MFKSNLRVTDLAIGPHTVLTKAEPFKCEEAVLVWSYLDQVLGSGSETDGVVHIFCTDNVGQYCLHSLLHV